MRFLALAALFASACSTTVSLPGTYVLQQRDCSSVCHGVQSALSCSSSCMSFVFLRLDETGDWSEGGFVATQDSRELVWRQHGSRWLAVDGKLQLQSNENARSVAFELRSDGLSLGEAGVLWKPADRDVSTWLAR